MYGGLGAHVLALTQEQARRGHEVTVITQAPIGEPAEPEYLNDVRVIRVANHYPDARLIGVVMVVVGFMLSHALGPMLGSYGALILVATACSVVVYLLTSRQGSNQR